MYGLKLYRDGVGLGRFLEATDKLKSEKVARQVYRKVINRHGAMMRRAGVKFLPEQTGLDKKVIRKALVAKRASARNLVYTLQTKGGYIAYRHFNAYETRQGVYASPRGRRILLQNHFIKGGRFPNRVSLNYKGTVFKPSIYSKAWGRDFRQEKSNVRIPDEMEKGQMQEAFEDISRRLPGALEREVYVMMGKL